MQWQTTLCNHQLPCFLPGILTCWYLPPHKLIFMYLPAIIHIMSDLHLYAPTCGIHHICMAFTVNFKSFLLLNELAREILISLEIWYEYIGFDLNKFQYPSAVKPLSWRSTRKAPNIPRRVSPGKQAIIIDTPINHKFLPQSTAKTQIMIQWCNQSC